MRSQGVPGAERPPLTLTLTLTRVYQAQNGQRNLAEQLKDGLTPYQISLLEKVRRANTGPIVPDPQ